ncbi:sulfotransferase [Pelomonas sp. Root1217]|uniref:sulfotransferase family protein n=1 Tax=Pelomonas sp. Root1217 TaxID=1736430 RepID=UPI00070DE064|nr:sulfotransferase [Pelomonas sp. Root1217]
MAVTNIHFISGLPRSGSTLLSALLNQNPRFQARMTSPLAALCAAVHQKTCGGEFGVFFDNSRRRTMLRGLFDSYYADATPEKVVFDTNRSWTGRMALLGELYPDARVICCVRDVGWIIDSVERMLNKNPLELSRMFGFQSGSSVYGRVESLMNSEKGLIGLSWSTLREAWFGDSTKRLLVVPYDHLVQHPARTLARLYEALGERPWDHDLNNVVYDEPDYDSHIGMPGLHTVRQRVESQERPPCIPHDIFGKYASANFWQSPELNPRGVVIV